MKQTFFLFLCFVLITAISNAQINYQLIRSTDKFVEFQVNFPEYSTMDINENDVLMKKLLMEGAYPVTVAGAPEILKSAKSIIIPENVTPEIGAITICSNTVSNFDLVPSKGIIYRNIDPSTVPYTKGPDYFIDAYYPSKVAELGDIYQFREMRGVSIVYYPFSYNPVKRELRVLSSLIIRVDLKRNSETVPKYTSKVTKDFIPVYKSHFLNYQESKYTVLTDEGSMLIISDSSFRSALEPLKAWKIKNGIPTEIVSVQSIGNNSSSIKAYITQYYNSHNLAYVLLVGDNAQIAPYITSSEAQDNWYAEVAGNDTRPDLFLGRFSAENITHVTTQVEKTVLYEQNPQEVNHLNKFCGIASDQGPGDNGEYDWQHIRIIDNKLANYTYVTNGSYELFEGSQGGLDAPGNPTAANLSTALNEGVGIISYCGHGSSTSFSTTGFNNANINNLNNVNKLPFILSVACVNGAYVNQTCFAETWLRAKKSTGELIGAVATVMSTINQPWNPPMAAEDEMINVLTETATSGASNKTFGGICFNGFMKMLDVYSDLETYRTWLIFGDPSLMIRTSIPQQITATHEPVIILGTEEFIVNSTVENAKIVLSKSDQIIGTGYISGGAAHVNIAPDIIEPGDELTVLVSKFNYIPYISNIMVILPNGPYLTLQPSSILNNNSQVVNNNNLLFANNYSVAPSVKNVGSSPATNISFILRSNDEFVTITDSIVLLNSAAPNTTTSPASNLTFNINSNTPDQHIVNFTLLMTCDGNSKFQNFSITVNSPIITITGYTIDDAASSIPNGVLDLHETANIIVSIKNTGHADIPAAAAFIETIDGLLLLSSYSANTEMIPVNSSKTASFTVTAHPVCTLSTQTIAKLTYVYQSIETEQQYFIPIGQRVEDWETNSFTKYEWQNDPVHPWTITTENVYEGTYAAVSGEIGNNEESTLLITIDLPLADSISFYLYVSSESTKDYLKFYIDGSIAGNWSGNFSWRKKSYNLSEGTHTLSWKYMKDAANSAGLDRAMLDYIKLPVEAIFSAAGISYATKSDNIVVYPNPATSFIYINNNNYSYSKGRYYVHDITGRILDSKDINNNIEIIDIDNYNPGFYFITIFDNNKKIKIFKVVKN